MGRVSATFLRRLLIVTLWFFATTAWAQQADIDRADRLMKEGKAAEAFAILDPLEDKMAGDVNFDYLFGISALDSGKSDRATIAFERVLAVNPNFAGARLDMARAYFQLGDLERAKNEFETVRGQNPPEAVQQVVTTYLATIEKAQAAKRRQLHVYVEGTVGRDTNANSGGALSTFTTNITAPGGALIIPFNLGATGIKQKDSFGAAATGVDYTEQILPWLSVFASADARQRVYFSKDAFDNKGIDGRIGLAFGEATNQLRVAVNGGRFELNNRANRRTEGISGEWKYQVNPANQFNATSQLQKLRFVDREQVLNNVVGVEGAGALLNSFNQTTHGLGWLRILADGKAAVFGNYFFGEEHTQAVVRADGDKRFQGIRLGGQYAMRENLDLFSVLSYQDGTYNRVNNIVSIKREDLTTDAVVGATWRFAKDWSLRPQVIRTRNVSNISLNWFRRTEYGVTVRRDFN